MRGKHEIDHSGNREYGITPAGAGKTLRESVYHGIYQDHPRRCGENATALGVAAAPSDTARSARLGSPPQVRGKRKNMQALILHERITPAGAGKT